MSTKISARLRSRPGADAKAPDSDLPTQDAKSGERQAGWRFRQPLTGILGGSCHHGDLDLAACSSILLWAPLTLGGQVDLM